MSKRRQPAAKNSAPPPGAGRAWRFTLIGAVLLALGAGAWFLSDRKPANPTTPSAPSAATSDDAAVFATYAGSASCRECHAEQFQLWEKSHHGLAERPVSAELDQGAFDPQREIKHGTQTSLARTNGGRFEMLTVGLDKTKRPFVAERAIGVSPLLQYLVPEAGGRWQTLELAYDPHAKEWFNVYGNEDRQPGEWGHWTGRGMNWNSMCASCHNTRLRKNYDPRTDTFSTAMAEMGVGCESCHGPLKKHVEWQREYAKPSAQRPAGGDPTVTKFSRDQYRDACAMCHARRGELTGDFKPGDTFFDHFSLTIPDDTDIFYPDGQVRDEDYEFTSFLSSKMHAAGVRCMDCHEPHSGKTRLPGNLICMTCHSGPTPNVPNSLGAPRIEPLAHSFHRSETEPGGRCVDCHMPLTTYMQRHPRHDHGFTIPDPLLTKQHGIPNACNRCHADRDADWSLAHVEKWYGDRMNRPSHERAQWIAQARTNAPGSATRLLTLAARETNALWRASAVNLLRRWAHEPGVTPELLRYLADDSPLVRGNAAQSLQDVAQQPGSPARGPLMRALNDVSRNVRVAAAWALRATVDTNSHAGRDLLRQLAQMSDQPGGAMQNGVFHFDRGDAPTALDWFRRAVQWDPFSPPFYQELAIALSRVGSGAEAVRALEKAAELAPREAEYRYLLGLARAEMGDVAGALAALEETVKLDPAHANGWYNLGLAWSSRGEPQRAIDALLRAESLDDRSPRIPYARATVLARLGRTAEARVAAQRALTLAPGYPEAQALLQALSRP
jgi:tetratricopeptide (TPR) repeat protein